MPESFTLKLLNSFEKFSLDSFKVGRSDIGRVLDSQ